ncbi:MAG: DUF971 domain-containing protein [Gammaproteobacteria bacterium]|nr:DUF971 domain-containing protein [Gammaproteobacteria bacterium]NNC98251.1 DUF971 domain-containing protein [Gammaproteobacteria bacterium]NNM14310.1 DUF971 domain-containing protein [Gammaproteobacteria bacterium]
MTQPIPTEIKMRQESRLLEVRFDDGQTFSLSWEYLRVFSPSAEVRGHSPTQAVLQVDKGDIRIVRIEPVGQYALRLEFDDGHNTGLYSWSYLYELGVKYPQNWQEYLDKLKAAGHSHPDMPSPD